MFFKKKNDNNIDNNDKNAINIENVENNNNNNKKENNTMVKVTVNVTGMMCGHCEATVKKTLEAIQGVEEAVVSHETGTAVVTLSGDVSSDILKEAVEAKDYQVLEIQ